jgi:hypothetical protein
MNVEQLVDMALSEAKKIPVGREFIVQDLFVGYIWKGFKTKTRQEIGRLFRMKIDSIDNIEKLMEKTASNQQKYIKTK